MQYEGRRNVGNFRHFIALNEKHKNNLAMSDKLDPDLLIPMITTDDTFIVGSVGNLQCVVSTNYTDASYTVDWIRRDTR